MDKTHIARSVWSFLDEERDFVLATIAVVAVVLGVLLASFQGRSVAPFVYARF